MMPSAPSETLAARNVSWSYESDRSRLEPSARISRIAFTCVASPPSLLPLPCVEVDIAPAIVW
jgi:hypothetical protein